ncbi:MAG: hypothetical protein ISS35_02150 [Kiritimatiellae bacterium]|nr:hypothetical protein [Kiritimatiellia bacterium]
MTTLTIAAALPISGAWLLTFMLGFSVFLLPIFPFILRRRKRRAQAELKARNDKAREAILEDGIVEGPKGPYVKHHPWNVGTPSGTPRDGPPKARTYHGGPWPD